MESCTENNQNFKMELIQTPTDIEKSVLQYWIINCKACFLVTDVFLSLNSMNITLTFFFLILNVLTLKSNISMNAILYFANWVLLT